MKFKIIVFIFIFSLCGYAQTSEKYILGEGDIIKVIFPKNQFFSKKYIINNKGEINNSIFGKLKVKNLSIKKLYKKLYKIYYNKIKNPKLEIKLLKSYKIEQQQQNIKFQKQLNKVKENFALRNYSKSIEESKKLTEFIIKINGKDNKVKSIKKHNLEIKNIKYKITDKGFIYMYKVSGILINNMEKPCNMIKIKIGFYDNLDRKIYIVNKYATKGKPLYKFQKLPFEFKGILNLKAKKIKLEISDFTLKNK